MSCSMGLFAAPCRVTTCVPPALIYACVCLPVSVRILFIARLLCLFVELFLARGAFFFLSSCFRQEINCQISERAENRGKRKRGKTSRFYRREKMGVLEKNGG